MSRIIGRGRYASETYPTPAAIGVTGLMKIVDVAGHTIEWAAHGEVWSGYYTG